MRRRHPREVRLVVSALALVALAGCTPGPPATTSSQPRVEVFTWWASGSEKLAFDVLASAFRAANPDVSYDDAGVAGGAGTAAKDVLASRLLNGDPPDTFQVHGGAELAAHVAAGDVVDLSSLYAQLGLEAVLASSVRDLVSVDGVPYAVPTNVHRANLIWANPTVLTAAGATPTAAYTSLDDWFAVLEKVERSGRTPLALGAPWTQVHLLEQVLLARLGPAAYAGLWDGRTDAASPQVAAAIDDYARLLGYANDDRDALDWPDVAERLRSGDAAFMVMGDWAQQTVEVPLTWAAFPGTNDVDDIVVDGFAQAVDAPDPDNARLWLQTVADHDVQVRFANAKGAIPARTDVLTSELTPYARAAFAAFRTDRIVLSLAHGGVIGPRALAELTAVVGHLGRGQASSAKVQDALVAAAHSAGD